MDFEKNAGVNDGGEKGDAAKSTKSCGRIESAVLSTVYSAMTLTQLNQRELLLLIVLDAFQLLHFSYKTEYMLSDSAGLFFNRIGAFTTNYSIFQILFYLAFILVLVNTIMILAIGIRLHRGQLRSDWPLKLLGTSSAILKSFMLIPIMNIFLSGLHCNYDTGALVIFPEHQCFGENLFMYIGSIIGLCIIIPYNLLIHITFLDVRPSPKHFATMSQGQSGTCYSTIRMALVFVHVLTIGANGAAYIALICNCVAFGYLTYVYSITLPFHSCALNRIRVGSFIGIFLSSISAIITLSLYSDETTALIGQIVAAAVGCAVGMYLPTITRQRILQTVYARIKEEIDLKSESPDVKKFDGDKLSYNNTSTDTKHGNSTLMLESSKVDTITTTQLVERPPIFQRETDVEIACRYIRHNNSQDGKGLMHFIFRCGLLQYPKSVFLHATYALYIHEFDSGKNRQARQMVQERARQLHGTFADRTILFFVQRWLETALRSGDDTELSISSLAEFESLEASARFCHIQTLEELRAFWGYLSSNNVTARVLPVFAQRMLIVERQGDEYYKKLISRFPKSKVMLRMYATWLQQVKNDPETATNYFELAEQIENNEANDTVKQLSEENMTYGMQDEDDNDDTDDTDNGQKQRSDHHGPELSLMKKASRSLQQLVDGVNVNYRVHTKSNSDFAAPYAVNNTTTEHPGSIKQTAELTEEDADKTQLEVFTEDSPKETHALKVRQGIDKTQMEVLAEDMPKETYELTVRQGASLEPDRVLRTRRPSEIRTVMMSDTGVRDNVEIKRNEHENSEKDDRERKDEYRNGPRSESNASSSASTKATRMKRVLKAQLEMRFTNEIHTFGKQIIGVNIFFLGLVIATYIVAKSQFTSFDSQFFSVKTSTQLGMRAVLLSQYLREQLVAARENNEKDFETAKNDYFLEFTLWKSEALPFLLQYNGKPYWVRTFVSQYPNGTGEYTWMNEFGIGAAIYQSGLQLANLSMQDFADSSMATNNNFRFFAVPNLVAITEPIDMLTEINQDAFVTMSEQSMVQLYVLIGILTFTVVGSGLGLFYPMVKKSGSTQVKIMNFFTKISKKACRHIHTNIEEDLENFVATGNDYQVQIANEAKLRVTSVTASGAIESQNSNRRFLRTFAMWLTAIFFCNLVVFIPPIVFSLEGVQAVKTVIWSDSTRYDVAQVLRYALELACHDDVTSLDYVRISDVVAGLKDRIINMQQYNELVTTGHGYMGATLDIKPLEDLDFIGDIGGPGMCLLLTPGACDPENRVYNASIGLTQEMAISGLDNFLNSYLSAAKLFSITNPEDLNVQNKYYMFMRQILGDIRDGLTRIVDRLLEQQSSKLFLYKGIMEVLFPLALVVVVFSNFAFRMIARNRIMEMHQVVQLLFSVPHAIVEETPQLSQFIQSGGVLGLEETF